MLGLASSSNRELIDAVLEAGGISGLFAASRLLRGGRTREARTRRLPRGGRPSGDRAAACVAVEDSHNGIRSAKAAGMTCLAIPNERFPPGEALAEADLVLASIDELTVELVDRL